MNDVDARWRALADAGLVARQAAELVRHAQAEPWFHLAAAKDERRRRLAAHFGPRGIARAFVSANLASFDASVPGVACAALPKGFFERADAEALAQARALLDDAVVVVNNNDVGAPAAAAGFAAIAAACERTIFVGWDWDNHHWLEVGTFLAAHCDVYAPAHHENLFALTRCNWLTIGPVYCATVQWPRRFLSDHLGTMIAAARSREPLGRHIPYAPFGFRNQVVSTLGQRYPSVGFSDRAFHGRTPRDRLDEWCAHRLHWIVPVLNDVPIRIFDALATGGIPIVPESMRLLPPVASIPRAFIAFYAPIDVLEPAALVERTNRLFDEAGSGGVAARHRFALEHHHGDTRLRQMLDAVRELYGITR